ncbi:MAG: hypothetical protein JJU27_17590, partial [Gammaproteobacteria bacterium]|nr:hypothetical protein [Gammaproteobacteria bacterium]
MPGKSLRAVFQGLLLLVMLAALSACGRSDSNPGTQASAAPDPFVGDYYDRSMPILRISQSGERYEATRLNDSGAPTGTPAVAVQCDDETRRNLDLWRQYDTVAACFAAVGELPQITIYHARATPDAMGLQTRTGYAMVVVAGAEPWEVRRRPPAG